MCPISIEKAFGTQSGTLHNKKNELWKKSCFFHAMDDKTHKARPAESNPDMVWNGMSSCYCSDWNVFSGVYVTHNRGCSTHSSMHTGGPILYDKGWHISHLHK